MRLVKLKTQLFGKSCVLCQDWEHAKQYGAWEVHKTKSSCAFWTIRWALPSITKLPFSLLPHIFAPLLQTNTGQESINQIQTQHHPTITGLTPQPISTFDNLNTKSTKSNRFYTILQRNPIMKSEPKKKNRADPFPSHVVGSGEEIKQQWRGRQAAVKAEIKHRSDPFLPFGFPLYISSFDENQMVWCVWHLSLCVLMG